jgi:putative aldouronate transport system substrate-binding protein
LVTRPQQGTSNNDNREIRLVDEDDPLGVYEKPLKVTVGQMVSATKYVNGEKASDNVIYDAYRELLNIDFEAQFSANIGEAYSYHLNMAAVSLELPDLFFCNQNELNDLIAQEMVEDLTDVYYKYASPALRLALEYNYTGDVSMWNNGNPEAMGLKKSTLALDTVSKDGRIYGFPFLSDLFNFCPLVWIRTDWLAKYAESKSITYGDISEVMPKDFQEYLDIVYYFSEANLHNGEKSYGVSFGFDGAGLQGISNVYGA